MCHTRFVFQRVLDELEWCSKGKHSLDRLAWSNLHVIAGGFRDIVIGRQIPETLRHMRKSVVCLKKTARLRIDKGNAAGHVCQDLFVKDDFAFDPSRSLCLATVEFACAPCGQGCTDQQPADKNLHLVQQIVHGFVGERCRLFDHSHPAC